MRLPRTLTWTTDWALMLPLAAETRPTVAALTPAHAPALADMHADSFARAWDAEEFEHMLGDPAILADGVFSGRGGEPLGFILSRRTLDEAEVLSVAVARSCRGAGFGRALLASHLPRLSAKGVASVFLEVEDGNAAALTLYRSFGFVEIGRRENYYVKADGQRAAALTMRLELATRV